MYEFRKNEILVVKCNTTTQKLRNYKVPDPLRTALTIFFILEDTTNPFEILTTDIPPEVCCKGWKNTVCSLLTDFSGEITEKLNFRFGTV